MPTSKSTVPAFNGTSGRDGGQREQLCRGCARQQRILTQEPRRVRRLLATRDRPSIGGGGAKGTRGRSLASRSANRLCASSTLSDTIVMKSSAAMRKQTVGSIARTVLRSAVP